jgi:SEC-C motif-containing protein
MGTTLQKDATNCPCGSGATYAACCGPFHAGEILPETAEQLMRSRYSAYVKGDVGYLEETLHPSMRKTFDAVATAAFCGEVIWLGLEVTDTSKGGPGDRTGMVNFVARFMRGIEPHEIAERSEFRRHKRLWYYVRAM